jgi:hypothetical protein
VTSPIDRVYVEVDADPRKFESKVKSATDKTTDQLESKLGKALDDLDRRFEGVGREAETQLRKAEAGGKKTAQAANTATLGVKKLDLAIKNVNDSIAQMSDEFARTGDLRLFEKIADEDKVRRQLQGIKKMMANELGDSDLGEEIMGNAFSGLRGLPAAAQAGLVKALVGVAVIAAPGIGAAIGAAVASGVGLAGIGGGIALAARDQRVKDAANDLADQVMEPLNRIGKRFVGPVVDALNNELAPAAMNALGNLEEPMNRMSSLVDDLARGVGGFSVRFSDGFAKTLDNAYPVVRRLAEELPELGDALGDMLAEMTEGEGATMAIVGALDSLESALRVTGETVGWLSDRFSEQVNMGAAMTGSLEDIYGWVPIVGDQIANANNHLEKWQGNQVGVRIELNKTATALPEVSKETTILTGTMGAAIDAAEGLKKAFDLINGATLSQREATREYEEAIDAVTEGIKENGKTLDVHTEKGRANQANLDALVGKTSNLAQATYDETLAKHGAVAAETAAARVYERGRAQLIRSAMAMGLSKKEAQKLADQIMKIPKTWSTKFTMPGMGAAKADAAALKRALDRLPREKKITIRVYQEGGDAGLEHRTDKGGKARTSRGGPVIGAGPMGVDSVDSVLAPGEFVMDYGTVRAAGGVARMEALRQALRGNAPLGDFGDGNVGTGPGIPGAPSGAGQGGLAVIFQAGAIQLTFDNAPDPEDALKAGQAVGNGIATTLEKRNVKVSARLS